MAYHGFRRKCPTMGKLTKHLHISHMQYGYHPGPISKCMFMKATCTCACVYMCQYRYYTTLYMQVYVGDPSLVEDIVGTHVCVYNLCTCAPCTDTYRKCTCIII